MDYSFDYEPKTIKQRDHALAWFRNQARAAHRLLLMQADPTMTPLAPNYDTVLIRILDQYRGAIERLSKMTFTSKGEKV